MNLLERMFELQQYANLVLIIGMIVLPNVIMGTIKIAWVLAYTESKATTGKRR